MPLLALPNELLLIIASELAIPSDISSFLSTNHRLFHLISPLFRDVACQKPYAVIALFWAAVTNNELTARHILQKGDNVLIVRRASGETGRKMVLHSTPGKFRDTLLKTVMEGAGNSTGDIAILDNYTQETALHRAVKSHCVGLVKKLLEKGADTSSQDIGGWTALHMASRQGNEKVVQLLLEKGADTNIEGSYGETALCLAGQHEAVARLLVDNGANPSVQDSYGRTPLHLATRYWHDSLTRKIIDKGASTTVRDHDGHTALHLAAVYGSRSLAVLIEKGADINAQDIFGRSPLHLAAKGASGVIVKMLLDKGADVTVVDHYGRTPLHLAAARDNEAVVRVLLGGGADIKARDNMGRTAFQVAVQRGGRGRWVWMMLEGGGTGVVDGAVMW